MSDLPADSCRCPVCGETITLPSPETCPSCHALLPAKPEEASDLIETSATKDARVELGSAAAPVPEDEYLEAFRRQFEEKSIRPPRAWSERLRRLIQEVEPSRRHATILFVDLRGYTRLTSLLPEPRLDALRQWFYQVCTDRIELHGGFVIQFLGDGVLAAFGAPTAFDRDAESAIKAALDIREEVRRTKSFDGHALSVRAGADCGSINVCLTDVHGQSRLDIFGSCVNLAARLEAVAATWEVLVSDQLAERLAEAFELRARAPFLPKNYPREVTPSIVIRHRGHGAVRQSEAVPFSGRHRERRQLIEWIEEIRTKRFLGVKVAGEAGIGKSRFVREALRSLGSSDDMLILQTSCEPHDRHQFARPALRILSFIARGRSGSAGTSPMSPDQQLEAIIEELPNLEAFVPPILGYLLSVEPHLSRLSQLPGKDLMGQVLAGLVAAVEASSANGPTLIAIDDMQWADDLTRSWIDALAARRPPSLGLILVDRRSEGNAAKNAQDSWRTICLSALTLDETRDVLASILDLDSLHPLARRRLLERTGGNPFQGIEFARALAKQQEPPIAEAIVSGLTESGDSTDAPGVREILQARIDALDRSGRHVLQCIALMNSEVTIRDLRGMPALLACDIQSELESLALAGFVQYESDGRDEVLSLASSALREVAVEMLSADRRRELHEECANRLEERIEGGFATDQLACADHWLRADRPDRALHHLIQSSRHAIAIGQPARAYEALVLGLKSLDTTAIESAPSQPPGDTTLLQQQGLIEELAAQSATLLGDHAKSEEHAHRFLSVGGTVKNQAWVARANFQLAVSALHRGDTDRLEQILESLHAVADIAPDLHGKVMNLRGVLQLRKHQLDDALKSFMDLALSARSLGFDLAIAGDAWNNAGLVYWQLSQLVEAERAFELSLDIWNELHRPAGQIRTLSNLGIIAEKCGKFDKSRKMYRRANGIAEELGYIQGICANESNLANLDLLLESWTEAADHAARSLRFARMIQDRVSEVIALENLGLAQAGAGKVNKASESLDEALRLAEETGDSGRIEAARLATAWANLLAGRSEDARARIGRVRSQTAVHLDRWRQIIEAVLNCLQDQRTHPLDELNDSVDRSWTLEDRVRLIDGRILLATSGLGSDTIESLRRDRRGLLAAVGDASEVISRG